LTLNIEWDTLRDMKNKKQVKPRNVLRSISLPAPLASAIAEIAAAESRSVSGQILFFLSRAVSQRDTPAVRK
jgi:hypothetical protein